MNEFWKSLLSVLLGGIIATGGNYFITLKNIKSKKEETIYKETFLLKYKAYNNLKLNMHNFKYLVFGLTINSGLIYNEKYRDRLINSIIEIETLITENNLSSIEQVKILNSKKVAHNNFTSLSHVWLLMYNNLSQITNNHSPNIKTQEFLLNIQSNIESVTLEYQQYLYSVLFQNIKYNNNEIFIIVKKLDNTVNNIRNYIKINKVHK
jgi:hypothetical protein